MSSATDNTSLANMTFRIPMETNEKSVIGTWEVYVNAKTSNGTLQKTATFQVAWPLQITSINFLDSNVIVQTVFAPGDTAKTVLTLNSSKAQNGNIDLNVQDSAENIINQTQMQDISFNATEDNRVVYEFKIPTSAALGAAILNADIFSGNYNETKIQAAQNKIVYFIIGSGTAIVPKSNATATPTPPPFIENTVSLFSWVLVATGFFTFTTLFMFLRRKPMPKIGLQKPSPSPNPSGTMTSTDQPTAKIAPEKIIKAAITTQLPSSYQNSEKSILESAQPQEQKQRIVNQLAKISSTSLRLQDLEAELKIEKVQLNQEIADLNKTLEEQEQAVKNYFDGIRQEIAKITPSLNEKKDIPEKTSNQQPDKKGDSN